jgi:GT2 family glycosyltransferase
MELIVIDNGSTMGQDMMMDLADIYVRNKENLGFTKAINQGIKLSSGKYIVIGNDDYFVPPDWEKPLIRILESVKDCGSITPTILGNPVIDADLWGCGLHGSWAMYKRETIDKIGLLDEQFKNNFSDTDYSFRQFDIGLRPMQTRLVVAEHYGGATCNKVEKDGNEYEETKVKFLKKWGNSKYMDSYKQL